MLERTDAITKEVLEPIMFVLAYPTVTRITCILIYARKNRCYYERGSRTNYVRSGILQCIHIFMHFN